MEWSDIEGNWTQFKGMIKENWGKLTDEDLTEIEGRRDRMLGKLQELYDLDYEDAELMLDERLNSVDIQGEGNYEAAREYQEAQHEFAEKFNNSRSDKSP